MEYVNAKSIIQSVNKEYKWFGIDYNMNLYKGCSHGCIYCDSRSNCYRIENFDKVRIKEECINILDNELKRKRKRGVIGIGAMSDTYNPFESKYEITRKALQVVYKYKFGISIDTKSDLIVRDIDILEKINKIAPVILKLTITTVDDNISKIIEPNVCVSSRRFDALKKLTDSNLFAGVLFTPLIPFITDTEENVKLMVKKSYECGAKFIFTMGGVTLRENQRDYFYNKLDTHFKGLKNKYINTYKNSYVCSTQNKKLLKVFKQECERYGLLYKMQDIINGYRVNNIKNEQLTLF